ncbi:MAG: TetR/AcrR family transcriptional regulator [Ferrimonas sp.]
MITPKTARSARKQQQMVASASELFMTKGYAETSMDDVAKHAQVSKQTVYAHFGSKNELFCVCIERKCTEVMVPLPTLPDSVDLRPQLMAFCMQISDVMQSAEATYVHRLCVSQGATHPQLAHVFYQYGPQQLCQRLTQFLEQLALRPQWQIPNPALAAEQLFMLLKGMDGIRRQLGITQETQQARQQRIAQALELFCRGYWAA